MGRELKRVPLDFAWSQGQVWDGYLNPFYKHSSDCEHCAGTGSSPEARHLKDQWYGYAEFNPQARGSMPYQADHPTVLACAERNVRRTPSFYGIGSLALSAEARRLADHFNARWMHHLDERDIAALIASGRLMDLTHSWSPADGWKAKEPAHLPTPAEVNAWSMQGMGHDSINQWVVVNAECERLGVSASCEYCDGRGCNWNPPEAEKQADEWVRIEPPSGDGYQMWSTTTEGHPISPVFAEPAALAEWLAANRKDTIDDGTTAAQWLKFIQGPGWAPSLVVSADGLSTGVQAA